MPLGRKDHTPHSHRLEGLSPNTEYFYRILFENKDGGVWSFENGQLKTVSLRRPTQVTADYSDFKLITHPPHSKW